MDVQAVKPWLDDGDVKLFHCHVLDVLRSMPASSVDCIITSPPYYGLRDYGTGRWEGGDTACDHPPVGSPDRDHSGSHRNGSRGEQGHAGSRAAPQRAVCGKCGARRVDDQIGLEASPAAYLDTLVSVFREARRVLADHGTCWVNLGDSYTQSAGGRQWAASEIPKTTGIYAAKEGRQRDNVDVSSWSTRDVTTTRAIAGLAPKNLLGMPWRLALALQDDAWILRRDIIWSKPNPMPESVTDRCTSAHEYVFMLTKRPRYWYDADAVREANEHPGRSGTNPRLAYVTQPGNTFQGRDGRAIDSNPAGRNLRSVWEIATQPTPEAHFATYPEELVRRCLLAGCPLEVCRECGKPRERLVETTYENPGNRTTNGPRSTENRAQTAGFAHRLEKRVETLGWSDCGHNAYRRGVVLDPFIGSGTTARVARNHGRHAIGIDLNTEYLGIAARRLSQQSLLGGIA